MELIEVSKVKPNPDNPRIIKDDKFRKLVKSLKEFPEMAKVRTIVVNKDMVVIGGNMRLKAMIEAGWDKVPVDVVDWDEEKQREFIIKDNVGFGEWNWDAIANEWDVEQVTEWGLDIPGFSSDALSDEEKINPSIIKITFESAEQLQQAENDIQEIIDRKYNGAYLTKKI